MCVFDCWVHVADMSVMCGSDECVDMSVDHAGQWKKELASGVWRGGCGVWNVSSRPCAWKICMIYRVCLQDVEVYACCNQCSSIKLAVVMMLHS